jgi:hypothetical protein
MQRFLVVEFHHLMTPKLLIIIIWDFYKRVFLGENTSVRSIFDFLNNSQMQVVKK